MSITIHRDNINYGPYTMDQVKELIAQRRVVHGDLAWVDGGQKWERLENLIVKESFRRQREAYVKNSAPKPDRGAPKKGKHANRWEWKPNQP